MNVATISKLAPLFEQLGNLCKNVLAAGDGEKYAKNVHAFNQDINDHCAAMRELIINASDMSTEQKLEHLKNVMEMEQAAKYKSAEAIRDNREHVAKIALVVTKAALSFGVSLAPEIIHGIKSEVAALPTSESQNED